MAKDNEPSDAEMFLREMEDPEGERNAPPVADPLEVRDPELEAEHAEVLDDLGGAIEPPGETDTEALKLDHSTILDDLSSALTPSEPTVAPTKDVAAVPLGKSQTPDAPAEQRGRYYVPPKDRTPDTREARRAEYTKWVADGAQVPPGVGEMGEGGGEGNGGVPQALEADLQHRDTSTSFLIDHTRKIQELTRRLEAERL